MALTPDDVTAARDDRVKRPIVPASLAFRCDVAEFEERTVVGVRGEVDIATASDLRRELLAVLVAPARSVTLDLGYCTFMDSSGCAVLVEAMQKARESNIELRLTSVPRGVRLVLELSGLTEHLGVAGGTISESATHPRRPAT
jgi:anti-anti-sigma factor